MKRKEIGPRGGASMPPAQIPSSGEGEGGGEKSHDLIAARLAGTNVCYVLSSGV